MEGSFHGRDIRWGGSYSDYHFIPQVNIPFPITLFLNNGDQGTSRNNVFPNVIKKYYYSQEIKKKNSFPTIFFCKKIKNKNIPC